MKKLYFTLLAFLVFTFSFAQNTIVTIDRANGLGPTATGNNTTSITSTGFTRGSGINSGNSSDFNSKSWNSNSQIDANTGNEYIQWSVSSNVNVDIDLTSLDIQLSRNNNGPQNWQIFYSLDNFGTSAIAIGAVRTSTTTETNYNFSNLVINSGEGGTITFRLYAWNANNNGGTLKISGESTWAEFGITDPGTRLSGQINSTPLFSTESTIISTSFNPTDNINYNLFNMTSGLNIANAIKIGEFTIRDGGNDLTDTDVLPTTLTDISFIINGDQNIAALALFDGITNISETSSISTTTTFNNINSGSGIIAPDEGTKVFEVYATFNTSVIDNEQLQLTITSASANGISGSTFALVDAGGAQSPIAGDDNRIEVTAAALAFDTQPSDVTIFTVMTPAPTVLAVDSNANLDLDYTGTVIISATATSFEPSATLSVNAVAGVATFSNILFNFTGTNESLLAITLDGLSVTISNPFNILDLIVTIASQDFDDSSPEWTYTTDIFFFDNGWGTDGYYGIINSSLISPLNYAPFSENILGSNDLNDEGNGTTGFATVTFSTIDISAYTDITLSFDWDTDGYGNNDDAQYEVFYDGVGQGIVDITNNGTEGSEAISVPDNVNSIGLQVQIKNSGDTAFCGFDNFLLASTFNGLIYYSGAWTPNAPSDTTGNDDVYVLNETYTVARDIQTNNFYIADLATTSVNPGESITVNSNLINMGALELNSTSTTYSSLILKGNSEGNVIYKRHVNINNAGNDLISAPVTGQTFGDFATANTNIFENPSNVSQKLFGPFNKTTGLYQLYDTDVPADANIILDAGNGYRAASNNSSTFTFEGTVETGIINRSIVISGPNSPEWNLIGNPYSSYITLFDFLAANNNELEPTTSGIYGYDGNASDGWEIWNQAYSEANPTALITPGQGFLVASQDGGGNITFNPTMRAIGNTDDFILNRSANPNLAHLKLQLSKTGTSYNTDIYFNDNASLTLDPGYDSALFGNYAPEFSIYSHLVEINSGLNLAIQSVNYNALNDVIVPLGVNASQGEQITFSIFETNIQNDVDIYLEDTITNTFTLLNTSEYVFTPMANLSGTGRFYLRFSGGALSTAEHSFNNLNIYSSAATKEIVINGQLSENTYYNLYDIQGRLVLRSLLNHTILENRLSVSNLSTGIYIIKLNSNNQDKTQKLVIE